MSNASYCTKQLRRNTLNSDHDSLVSPLKAQPWSLVLYHLAQGSQRKKDNFSREAPQATCTVSSESDDSRASCYLYEFIPYTKEQSNTPKHLDFQIWK